MTHLKRLLHPLLAGGRRHGASLGSCSGCYGWWHAASASTAQVRSWLETHYDIPGDSIVIKRYFLEDCLIIFSYYDDMLRVLHEPPRGDTPFILVFKRWRR
jgi:hypothetical protein